jgi:hypothetical protein
MSSAGLKPSAAITRGMTETQAAIVNSRWLRHSAAGVSEAPIPRALRGQRARVEGDLRRPEPEPPLRCGDPSPQTPLTPRSRSRRRVAVVRAAALAGSEAGHRFPFSWLPEQ